MRNKSETIWLPIWVELLSKCKKRVFLFDLDGTVWDDLLVVLNEEWEHRLYAERDLAALEARQREDADGRSLPA